MNVDFSDRVRPNDRILWLPEERSHLDFDYHATSARSAAGMRITPENSLRSTVVLACARVLAETVATLPLHVYRREENGRKLAPEHPLYGVLHDAPNGWQTSFEWREQAMMHLCLYGNAYSQIISGSAGAVSELQPLHPSRMKVERIENGRLRYRYKESNGTETVYVQDQIMHLRWMSDDGVNGMVPVELAKDAVALSRACEIHGASFFGNGARPGVVLETDQILDQGAANSLRDNWERVHRGSANSYKTAVLMGGLKAHEVGGNNSDSQFLESRRFQVEEICRLFRVPPHMVGDLTRSSFSNIEQQSIDFMQHTIIPWLKRFEGAFGRDLVSDRANFFVEFDAKGFLRGDASTRASFYSTLWNLGVISTNEIRSLENMNPVEGGDQRFRPLNMAPLEETAPQAEGSNSSELIKGVVEENQEERATPESVDVGDFVSWASGDGRGRGRITKIVKESTINVPDSSFEITGTPEDPAALIRLYEETADGWAATDTQVGHLLSTLSKIETLE